MNAALGGAVELLACSLGYTGAVLRDVDPGDLDRPTPCERWTLGALLAHLEDALDAFTEAAGGRVLVDPGPRPANRVEALHHKTVALYAAWAGSSQDDEIRVVRIGALDMAAPVLVATAALEVTLHGWDVAQSVGTCSPVPTDLGHGLLGVAMALIDPDDRRTRFAAPRSLPSTASASTRLLAWSGRGEAPGLTGPARINRCEARTRRGLAS